MSLRDISGHMSGINYGATSKAKVVTNAVAPVGERQNKTLIYISKVTDTRVFLTWIGPRVTGGSQPRLRAREWCLSYELLMNLEPRSAHCNPLMGTRGGVFTSSLSRRIVVYVCWSRIVAEKCPRTSSGRSWRLDISIQGVLQLCSGRRDQEASKSRPLTPHFIVSVARGRKVAELRSLTDLCGLPFSVKTYIAPKGLLQCKRCQRFGHKQRQCSEAPRYVVYGETHLSGECSASQQQHKCCSCGWNHTANAVVVWSGRRPRRCLLNGRLLNASRGPAHPAFLPRRRKTVRAHLLRA